MGTECSITKYQMITKESYKDLKEYWDYQRKIAYNKEMVFMMADSFDGRVYNDFGMVSLDDMKELLWTRVKPEDYEEPRKDWVPEDPKLRFEWEGPAYMPKIFDLTGPRSGRPVILRAKKKMIKVFDDIVDIFDQEIIKHQILNETYHQYIDDVSIANNQHQRRPGF